MTELLYTKWEPVRSVVKNVHFLSGSKGKMCIPGKPICAALETLTTNSFKYTRCTDDSIISRDIYHQFQASSVQVDRVCNLFAV